MKNKAIKTKLLTVLLALCMVLSLVPMTAFAADPATETADFTASDGGAAAIALLNRYKSFGAADSTWDNGTKTLTLRGIDFTTKAATAVKLPDRTTIVLADGTYNTIQSGDVSIDVSGSYKNTTYINALAATGNLTVQSETAGTGTLSVCAGSVKNSGDGWTFSSGINVCGDLTVKGGQITAQGGYIEGYDSCFSIGVNMDNDIKNKALLVTGGTLTAVAGEAYELEEGGTKRAMFSRGIYMYRGNVSVSGNGKLFAESVSSMSDGGVLSNGLYISVGNLFVANNAEVKVSGAYGAYISGGEIRLDGGKLTAASTQTESTYGNAIDTEVNSRTGTANAGSITVNGGTLETENGHIYMSTYGATETQGIFTVTDGTVLNKGQLSGAKRINISGGSVQTQGIDVKAMTLSGGNLTVREPVRKSSYNGKLYAFPAVDVRNLTVSGGTLDAAWDWGEYTPIVLPKDEEYNDVGILMRIPYDTDTVAFTGGTTILDTGKAGNTAMLINGTLTLGDGMEITGADTDRCQLRSDTPVKIAAATPAAVENVTLDYENISYKAGDTPRAAASVSGGNCAVAYEYWTEIRRSEGGGQWYETGRRWYSDSDKMAALPADERIINFEAGNSYQYSVVLAAGSGYSFSNDETVVSVGEDEWGIPRSHKKLEIKESGKELHIKRIYTFDLPNAVQPNAIASAAVENVKLDYKDSEAPKASARRAGVNMDKYDILYESWEKREKTDEFTTETVAYWYSDESWYQADEERLTAFDKDGQYQYSVRLKARDGYTFSGISADDITLNGKNLPDGSDVIVLDEGRSCLVIYGTTLRTVRPLESVILNGVSTEFYVDGDKPRFNGYSGSAFSDVAYEKWEDKDDRSVGINSDESLNGGYGQLIESFKYGKTYTYGVAFNIADLGLEQGYRFDENTKLYLHEEEVTLNPQQVQVTDGGMTICFTDVFSMTPEAPWQKIDLVEIEGATVNFKAGDKPVFTGKVPDSSPHVLRQCEFWEGSDGSGVNSYWFWDQNYENHITAFESGKTYTYGVYVKAAHGYYFTRDTKLKINGKFYNYHLPEGDPELDNPDFMATLWAVTDLTVTPVPDAVPDYKIIEGQNGSWTQNSNDTLTFRANGDFSKFTGIKVDGITVPADKYTAASGSTVITLKKAYLGTLSVGKHTLSVVYSDGECGTEFEIKAVPHSHSYGTEWKYDGTSHWHECICGDKADTAAHTFEWVTDKEPTDDEKGSKHEECTVCHATRNEHTEIPATGEDCLFAKICKFIIKIITKFVLWILDFINGIC